MCNPNQNAELSVIFHWFSISWCLYVCVYIYTPWRVSPHKILLCINTLIIIITTLYTENYIHTRWHSCSQMNHALHKSFHYYYYCIVHRKLRTHKMTQLFSNEPCSCMHVDHNNILPGIYYTAEVQKQSWGCDLCVISLFNICMHTWTGPVKHTTTGSSTNLLDVVYSMYYYETALTDARGSQKEEHKGVVFIIPSILFAPDGWKWPRKTSPHHRFVLQTPGWYTATESLMVMKTHFGQKQVSSVYRDADNTATILIVVKLYQDTNNHTDTSSLYPATVLSIKMLTTTQRQRQFW